MLAKKLHCTIQTVRWLNSSTLSIQFSTNRSFRFFPGQFISVEIPALAKGQKRTKRLYSIASSPEEFRETGILELCVHVVPNGIGSEFFLRSSPGDKFFAHAPYGDFQYRKPHDPHAILFIGTGTGAAPLRSMVLSKALQEQFPTKALCLLGFRHEDDRLFHSDFVRSGVKTEYALSEDGGSSRWFHGRVTDFMKQSSFQWPWLDSEYFLCGNLAMIRDVIAILISKGVHPKRIHSEAFTATSSRNGWKKSAEEKPTGKEQKPSDVVSLAEYRASLQTSANSRARETLSRILLRAKNEGKASSGDGD